MALPPISSGGDPLRTAEAIRSLAAEYNRADRFAPIIGTDTGTATAYAIAPVPGVTQYNAGQIFIFKATHANTGTTPTLNVNGLGAGTITNLDGSALAVGDIPLNGWIAALCTSTTPTFAILPPLAASALLTTRGDLLVRGANGPQRLALGTNGQLLTSNGTDAIWSNPITATTYTSSLSGNVPLNNTANYFDGPSITTTGPSFISGTVTIQDTTAGTNTFSAKLWDGTTVISSAFTNVNGSANSVTTVTLSGPALTAGTWKISVRGLTTTAGNILFNVSGTSKDSTISAIRTS